MKTSFWEEEKSLWQLLKEFKEAEPFLEAPTLWDLFADDHPYEEQATADTSEAWLQTQEQLIEEILSEYLSQTPYNREEIEQLIESIQEFTFPEEEQEIDYVAVKYRKLAKYIAETYILPYQLNDSTLLHFLDALEDRLRNLNKAHIAASDKALMEAHLRLRAKKKGYSDEKLAQMLSHLELMWHQTTQEEQEIPEEEADLTTNDFVYPQIALAYSTTFYGFDDAGHLSYHVQERLANERFRQYEQEISMLLGKIPDKHLQPRSLDYNIMQQEEQWCIYEDFTKVHPFTFEFEGRFTAWEGNGKVLFLSMRKEDKELPYIIDLGALTLDKYEEILEKYHQMLDEVME
ncbi:MAG: hypothetical protein ACFB0B_23030 [Thermonemataceae bacterium]